MARFRPLVQALALAVLAALAATPGRAQTTQSFQTTAPEAILIDADSGTVLFEKNADELNAPASMAKTMTVELVFNEMKKGRINLDTEFVDLRGRLAARRRAVPAARRCSPSSTAA